MSMSIAPAAGVLPTSAIPAVDARGAGESGEGGGERESAAAGGAQRAGLRWGDHRCRAVGALVIGEPLERGTGVDVRLALEPAIEPADGLGVEVPGGSGVAQA